MKMKKIIILIAICLCFVCQLQAQVNLGNALFAHLPLNGNGIDISANNNNATVSTAGAYPTSNVTNLQNEAMLFNGAIENGSLDFGSPLLNNHTEFSMSFWFNPSSLTNGMSLVGQDNILETGFYTAPTRIVVFHPTSASVAVNLSLGIDNWQHFAVTCSATQMRFYLNGVLVNTLNGNYSLGNNSINTNIGGNVVNQSNNSWFRGRIDEVRFYTRVINQDEVNVLSGSGSLTYILGSLSNTTFCAGASFTIPLTVLASNIQATNVFNLQLSDENGNFNNPVTLAIINGSSSGNFNALLPTNIPSGAGYKLRTVSSLPAFIGAVSTQTLTINNPSQSFSTLNNSRILWYKFDGNAADSSGNNLNATLVGGTSYTTDRFGNTNRALQLNGTNGHAVAPSGVYFDENSYSVSVWVNPAAYNSWSRIYDFGRGQATDNILSAISNGATGNLAAQNYNNATGGSLVGASTGLRLNQWSHYTATYDGTNISIYVNGNLLVSGAGQVPRLIFRNLCYIGRSNWAADGYANAAFDDFAIYNRVLTTDEIKTLANDGIVHYNQTPCTGSALQLSAPLLANATYQWSGSNGFTSTSRTNSLANVTAANSGNYSVTITLGSCIYSFTKNITVINPASQPAVSFTGLPTITNTGVSAFTLSGIPVGGYFSGPGIQNANQFNPALAGVGTHTVYYQVLGTGGCLTTSANTVTVLPSYNIQNGTVTGCSGGFYDSGGSISNYSANENFTQTFCSDNGQRLRFTFSAISLGTGDTLWAYDGNSINGKLLGIYIPNSRPDIIWSDTTCITFRFKSDASAQTTGWTATFECLQNPEIAKAISLSAGVNVVCNGKIYDPAGTANYGYGYNVQTLKSRNGERMRLDVFDFNINFNNGGHWLRVYDGPSTAYPTLGQYNSCCTPPSVFTSSGEYLTVEFDANNTNSGVGSRAGFGMDITCFGAPLTEYIISDTATVNICEGVFYDSGGPNVNYNNNESFTKTFCSNNGQLLRFDFNNFTTAFGAGDTLWAYDGADANTPLLGMYIAASEIDVVKSSGTCLTFRFRSNNTDVARGWQGFVKCVNTQTAQDTIYNTSGIRTVCNAILEDNSNDFAYGIGYNVQTYKSSGGQRLKFQYSLFQINGNNGGHWLRIYDGPNTSFPLIGAYNNFNFIPASVESTGEFLTFEFDRNNTNAGVGTQQGYQGLLTCTTPALPIYNMANGTITTCEGVFYDNNGPAVNYSDNQNLTQTFCSANNQLLSMVFNVNETAFAAGDTLWAFDGPNTTSPPLGIYFVGSRIEPLTSSGTCLTFRYNSNATANARGWQGVISCITSPPAANTYIMSSGTRYVCNGVFLDPGGSGNYPVGGGNTWEQTFTSYSGERLRATVNFININGNNGGHWLRVYDGPTTASPLIGSYNNFNGWPPAFESTGSTLTFRFESTNTNAGSGAGFQLTFTCFTGSPIDVAWLASPACRGTTIDVPYTVNTSINANNTYTVQLSNAAGSFASPTNIGTLAATALTGTITATIPVGTAPGNGYRIRVNSSQPVQLGSSNPNPITIIATPTQPSTITVNGSTTFCSGSGAATLSITNQASMNYQWIKNDTTLVGTNSNSFIASQPGVYEVAIYNNCDSLVSTSAIIITSIDAPIAPSINANGPTTFCNGGNVELSIPTQTGVNYQWKLNGNNVGANNNTYVATQAGAYNISITNSCGSQNSSNTIQVTISGVAPTQPTSITGSASVCQTSSQNYSVSAVSGATSYTWTLPSGWTGTSTTTSISAIVGSLSGTISVTANNSCGSSIAQTLAVTVNPTPTQPTSITGSATVCQTSSQNYSISAVSGATSYTWTLPSGWTGTSTTTSISATVGSLSGTISVTANNSCGSSTAQTLALTVNPTLTQPTSITGSASVCQTSSQNYSVSAVSGATSYTWTLPSGWTGTSTTTSISATVGSLSGTISVTANNSCGSSIAQTLAVSVSIVDTSISITTSTLTSNATLATYQWVTCPSFQIINGATNQTFTPTQSGNYAVIVTQNGCSDTSNCNQITLTGISNISNTTGIIFYPNPASTEITFELPLSNSQQNQLTIIDVLGREVSKNYLSGSQGKITISIQQLPNGLYFFNYFVDDIYKATGKFVKE